MVREEAAHGAHEEDDLEGQEKGGRGNTYDSQKVRPCGDMAQKAMEPYYAGENRHLVL